jgi:hypothetical protein
MTTIRFEILIHRIPEQPDDLHPAAHLVTLLDALEDIQCGDTLSTPREYSTDAVLTLPPKPQAGAVEVEPSLKPMRIPEALPDENIIFPDDFTGPATTASPSPFPDFCCLDCQHLETAFRDAPEDDDPCLLCSKGSQEQFTTGDEL